MIKNLSIKYRFLFQIIAPIFTIIATICYNFRKNEAGEINYIQIGLNSMISLQYIWLLTTLLAVISYFLFYLGQCHTNNEIKDLKNDKQKLQSSLNDISNKYTQLQSDYENLLINHDDFFYKILSLIYVNLNLGGKERISIYLIPKNENIFILLFRFSKNKLLKGKSSKNYPFQEGFIYKAITESGLNENISISPDENIDKYIEEVQMKCNISAQRIKDMNMKSRSYFIKTIEGETTETIGLIVLESLDQNKFQNIEEDETFKYYSTIIKEFIQKHNSRFFSNLAANKGF